MKKIFFIAAFLLGISMMQAAPVNSNTALRVAENFWRSVTGETPKAELVGDASFGHLFIFHVNGEGFVIVAGDDRAFPILGYGTDHVAGDMGPETRFWLGQYEAEIEALASGQLRNDDPVLAVYIEQSWNSLLSDTWSEPKGGSMVPALLNTRWDQSPYYNYFCPEGTPVGCVATAAVQIMKFWNHPVKGSGSHSYNTRYGVLSANFDTTYYDWGNMPWRLSSSSSMAQVYAVATLSYHMGVAVEMDYDASGSGANVLGYYPSSPSARNALINYFGYKNSMRGYYKSEYSDAEWVRMLKEELDLGRPILYAGYDNSAGHAFVFDGYNSSSQFHVNWGWSGAYNGFFSMGALNPAGGGVGTNTSNTFNNSNQILIGIEPQSRLGISSTASLFGQLGGSSAAQVTTTVGNGSGWVATSSAPWLTISPSTGSGNGVATNVSLSAAANTTGHDRQAVVTVVQGGDTATLLVQQMKCDLAEMCTLSLKGQDSRGDGWEDGCLTLASTDGLIYGTFGINDGSYAIQDIAVGPDTVIATWHRGRSDGECGFFIENQYERMWVNHVAGSQLNDGDTFVIVSPCASTGGSDPLRCALHVNVNDTNRGYVMGESDEIAFGESHTVEAHANQGYRFVNWNDGSAHNPRTLTIVGNRTITARFDNLGGDTLRYDNGNYYTTIGSGESSTYWGIRLDGSNLIGRATLEKIKFYNMAAGNYTLSIFQGDQPVQANLISTTTFYQGRQTRYRWVEKSLDPVITVDHSRPLWVVMSSATGSAVAAAANWSGNVDGSWFSSDGVSWSPVSDEGLYSTWMLRAYLPVDNTQYTLTVNTNSRRWGTATGGGMYRYGEPALLTATPKEGCHFEMWSDQNTQNPRTYYVKGDQIITAIFAEGEVGIDEAEVQNIKVYNEGLRLMVRGAEGQRVSVYDALGRCVYHSDSYNEMAVTLPSTGVFVVRVNEAQPRKIAVF